MYIKNITIKDFRTFRDVQIDFSYNEKYQSEEEKSNQPGLPNVNLLLANNGMGKTTLLKAIALAALGPAVADAGIYPYRLIRREPDEDLRGNKELSSFVEDQEEKFASIHAEFVVHKQDKVAIDVLESKVNVIRKGDIELLRWKHIDEKTWHPIYSSESDAFFFVGYGATRRVEKKDILDIGSRNQNVFSRAQRIQSLFEEAYSLIPLSSWLPGYKTENPGRYKQTVELINRMMGKDHYKFTGELIDGEYIFEKRGLKVPFPALSDGYRAYLGWVGDLLYHVCTTCPSGTKLTENRGIVMVDEIDLHIHPKWQISMLPTLVKALPNIQFIVTSHSPLVVGSLEWKNIIAMIPDKKMASKPTRIKQSIRGLDADQILLTDFFGMKSTRVAEKEDQLQSLTEKARAGDKKAAKQLLEQLTKGLEQK